MELKIVLTTRLSIKSIFTNSGKTLTVQLSDKHLYLFFHKISFINCSQVLSKSDTDFYIPLELSFYFQMYFYLCIKTNTPKYYFTGKKMLLTLMRFFPQCLCSRVKQNYNSITINNQVLYIKCVLHTIEILL